MGNSSKQIDQELIQEQKLEFLKLNDKEGDLKRLIQEIIENLNKYKGFSLKYKIEESDNVILNSLIEAEYQRFNDRFPGFLKDPQDMINFFRYQRSILISETLANLEKKYGKRIEYILGIGSIAGLQSYLKDNKETFVDHKGREVPIKTLFLSPEYYTKNYEKILSKYGVELPAKPDTFFGVSWNKIMDAIGLKAMSFEELKVFFDGHKNDTFIDSRGKKTSVKNLFDKSDYYKLNYEIVNEEFLVLLVGDPFHFYKKSWSEMRKALGLSVNNGADNEMTYKEIMKQYERCFEIDPFTHDKYYYDIKETIDRRKVTEIVQFDSFCSFFKEYGDKKFIIDSEGKDVPILKLFSSKSYYNENYKKLFDMYGIILPNNPSEYYKIPRKKIIEIIKKGGETVAQDDFFSFFDHNYKKTFTDSEGKDVSILKLFSSKLYYMKNYKNILDKYGINLPYDPTIYYNILWSEIELKIWYTFIKKEAGFFSSFQDFKEFCRYPGNLIALKNFDNFNYYKGVFCDIDGTLILNETEVNEKVVNLLLSLYNKGLNITLRTAGDIQKKIKLLEGNLPKLIDAGLTVDILSKMGIRSLDGNRNLKNKYNYKNSIVELVIDDRHNKRFMYQVGIIPQKYFNVNRVKLLDVQKQKGI